MKQTKTLLQAAIGAVVLFGTAFAAQAQFVPAPTDGARIVCTTTLDLGKEMKFKFAGPANSIWIDLNNNGSYDAGEEATMGNNYTTYLIGSKEFTIYGDATMMGCATSGLSKLDLQHNPLLTEIDCSHNMLTALDLSKQTALKMLDCQNNQIAALDLTANTALTKVQLRRNKLKELDLTPLTALTDLNCSLNELDELNVWENHNLVSLDCSFNPLGSIDVSNNTELKTLGCEETELTELNVGANPNLEVLGCSFNELETLSVSNNTKLKTLDIAANYFTTIDLSKNLALTGLDCSFNEFKTINISNNFLLKSFDCSYNHLKTLDLSNNIMLQTLWVFVNQFTEAGMGQLVNTMPTLIAPGTGTVGQFIVVDQSEASEANICTPDHVAVAKGKKWRVYNYNGGVNEMTEFEGVPTSLAQVSADGIVIRGGRGVVQISGLSGNEHVAVYGTGGRTFYTGTAEGSDLTVNLPAGTYVVKAGTHMTKVAVR